MAQCMRRSVEGLLLLCFLLVVCFACRGCAHDDSIKAKRSNMMIEVSHVVRPPCYKDKHQVGNLQYCCKTDKLCWEDLGECFTNCPCKINCPSPPATE
ncbi:hypothetical protein ZWY2020_026157 [Hordeum vulgare]|nr:hypothetical protein ZWY2020_026157 [Hordeum vulgare]